MTPWRGTIGSSDQGGFPIEATSRYAKNNIKRECCLRSNSSARVAMTSTSTWVGWLVSICPELAYSVGGGDIDRLVCH